MQSEIRGVLLIVNKSESVSIPAVLSKIFDHAYISWRSGAKHSEKGKALI